MFELSRDPSSTGRSIVLAIGCALAVLCAPARAAEEIVISRGTVEPAHPRVDRTAARTYGAMEFPEFQQPDLEELKQEAGLGVVQSGIEIEDGAIWGPDVVEAPSVGNSFFELSDNGLTPPDGALAAGPRYLVALANGAVAYFTKNGQKVFEDDFSPLFFSHELYYDPRVLYDQATNRFFAVAVRGTSSADSHIGVAISLSSNPRDGWCSYQLTGNYPAGSFSSYPTLGVNEAAVFIATEQFGSAPVTNRVLWLPKSDLVACAATSYYQTSGLTMGDGSTARAVHPAHSFGSTPSLVEYLAASYWNGGSEIRVWRVNSPLASPSITAANRTVTAYSVPPDAQQPAAGAWLDTVDARLLNLIWRNGHLWMTHSVAGFTCGMGSCSAVGFKEIDVGSYPVMTVEQDFVWGVPNYYYLFPAIAVSSAGDVSVVFGRTSASGEYPSVRHSGQLSSSPGTLQSSSLLKAGSTSYTLSHRWGDYFGASVDWCPNRGMWVEGEYASGSTTWSKWAANTFAQPSPGNNTCLPAIYISSFPYSTIQDTSFATFEEQDLAQSCGASSAAPGNSGSVWFFFEAPGSGLVTIDTFGSNYDTVLSAYSETGACAGLTEVACNDDMGVLQSQITFAVQKGKIYDVLATDYGWPDCLTMSLQLHASFPSFIFADGFENGSMSRWSLHVP